MKTQLPSSPPPVINMMLNKLHGRSVKNITVIIFIIIINFIIPPKPAAAQTVSLSIWPPILEIMVKPGKSITQVYKLTNLGDDTIIKAAIFPFEPTPDGQALVNRTPSPIADYFSLQNADLDLPAAFPLKAGETQELVLKIKVPAAAHEADYYLTFLFESSDLGVITGTGSKTLGSIGANILLTVSSTGQPAKSGQISQLAAAPCLFPGPICLIDSFSPIKFTTQIQNTGPSYFKAIGQLEIYNTFNRKISTLPFREDNVLANSTRYLVSNTPGVKNSPTPGVEWVSVFPLGRYKTVAAITPSDTTIQLEKTLIFYALPYKLIFLLLAITFAGYYYYHK